MNNQAVLYALDSMSSNSMKSSNPHSGFHAETIAKTLQAGGVDPTCNQGGNVIVEPVYALQGNGIDRPAICFKAGQGAKARSLGLSERVSPTLNSEAGGNAVPSVCFDARGNGDGMHCPTLTGDHENRVTDYTAITAYRNPKFGECVADGTASTMAARDFKSPRDLVVEHPPAYGVDCRNAALDEEKTHTLQAKASGGQSLNCTPSVLMDGRPPRKYIIRRLTPTECARLQGFPDGWGHIVKKQSFTSDEYKFWLNVRNIHAAINGKTVKDYTEAQMVKWYNKLHTDSAEYKMWGNGIALPPALYCMQGILDALNKEAKREDFTWETIEAMWS